jgi:hypothetical protein
VLAHHRGGGSPDKGVDDSILGHSDSGGGGGGDGPDPFITNLSLIQWQLSNNGLDGRDDGIVNDSFLDHSNSGSGGGGDGPYPFSANLNPIQPSHPNSDNTGEAAVAGGIDNNNNEVDDDDIDVGGASATANNKCNLQDCARGSGPVLDINDVERVATIEDASTSKSGIVCRK